MDNGQWIMKIIINFQLIKKFISKRTLSKQKNTTFAPNFVRNLWQQTSGHCEYCVRQDNCI